MMEFSSIISNHQTFKDLIIKKVCKESHVCSLWAGYGNVHRIEVQFDHGRKEFFVIKRVNPPEDDRSTQSISHLRKLRSYHVEANFYNNIAPILLNSEIGCTVPVPYSIIESSSSQSFQFILSDFSPDFSPSYGSLDRSQTHCAVSWLAKFHASFFQHDLITPVHDDSNINSIVWDYGGYWHLKTRLDELEAIDARKHNKFSCFHPKVSQLASIIDERMNQSRQKSHTLVHGDYKKDNIMFSDTSDHECAVFDFQYCGAGYGMKDVVMLIVSSVSRKVLSKEGEEGLLTYYYDEFIKYFKDVHVETGEGDIKLGAEMTLNTMKKQYELCLLDYVRFMSHQSR